MEQKSLNQKRFSRRNFIALGSLGALGVWVGSSNQLAARTLRGVMADARRAILKPKAAPAPESWKENTITAAWLGHSTVLLNFYGIHIITDPVLFNRIGADTGLGTLGPKRLLAPALRTRELPQVDLVVLSHGHMDHLNSQTLRCFPKTTQAVTASRTADLLTDTRLKEPKELAWGEKTLITTEHGDVEVEAFEVKHWGARWRHDKHRGYNGYILSRAGKKIIFGGDTAWSDSFAELRSKGPFELAIMPIGAYQPWIQSHCTPEQAVQMADNAGANHILPVHFSTFALGREGVVEPIERLHAAVDNQRIGWSAVGETFSLS